MQIVRDFCDHSNAICENCRLPALAGEFCAANGRPREPEPARALTSFDFELGERIVHKTVRRRLVGDGGS